MLFKIQTQIYVVVLVCRDLLPIVRQTKYRNMTKYGIDRHMLKTMISKDTFSKSRAFTPQILVSDSSRQNVIIYLL